MSLSHEKPMSLPILPFQLLKHPSAFRDRFFFFVLSMSINVWLFYVISLSYQ
ncbi:hypothetical protein ACRRTK_022539 [Alexandromys fortis]